MKQEFKVFILNLNGLSRRKNAKQAKGPSITGLRFFFIKQLFVLMRICGYKQISINELSERTYGKYFCPTLDVFDAQSFEDWKQLKPLIDRGTLFIAPGFIADGKQSDSNMFWNKMRGLIASGWELGIAGYRYVKLTSLRYTAQQSEITKASRMIAERSGTPAKTVSFPFGTCDATTLSCCRESGIVWGISFNGLFELANSGKLMAPRFAANQLNFRGMTSLLLFMMKRPSKTLDTQGALNPAPLSKVSSGSK